MKADKKVKKYNRGGVMAHDKKELRNLSDEDYRIRNRSGSNTDAERRRIDGERSYLRNQESSVQGYARGGRTVKKNMGGGIDAGISAAIKRSSAGAQKKAASDEAKRVRNRSRVIQEAAMDNPESRFYTAAGRYAKGGKVRGCGVAQRGLTKGTVR